MQRIRDIGNLEDVCPYCSKSLTKRPQKKAKCPHCGKYILVRTRQSDRQRVLVTENQAYEIEAQWSEIQSVAPPHIDKKKGFDDEKKILTKKFGQESSDNDVIWSLLNKELVENSQAQHWGLYRNTLFEMAELLRSESRLLDALKRYFEVCYLDLNGPSNYGGINDMDPDLLRAVIGEEIKPFNPDRGEIYPGVLQAVKYLMKSLEMNSADAHLQFLEAAGKLERAFSLPLHLEYAWKAIEKELFNA